MYTTTQREDLVESGSMPDTLILSIGETPVTVSARWGFRRKIRHSDDSFQSALVLDRVYMTGRTSGQAGRSQIENQPRSGGGLSGVVRYKTAARFVSGQIDRSEPTLARKERIMNAEVKFKVVIKNCPEVFIEGEEAGVIVVQEAFYAIDSKEELERWPFLNSIIQHASEVMERAVEVVYEITVDEEVPDTDQKGTL